VTHPSEPDRRHGRPGGVPGSEAAGDSEQPDGVKVTDKRRIDPETGQLRSSPPGPAPSDDVPGAAAAGDLDAAEVVPDPAIANLTADLQRVHAEYANYRRRVDRDRELVREQAVASVFAELLPILDDLGRAREHGDFDGAFKSVGESLEAAVARLGLERYGEIGEPFDPTIHEALTHEHRDDVAEPTCVAVFQPGYRFAGRVIRPARVGVAEPS